MKKKIILLIVIFAVLAGTLTFVIYKTNNNFSASAITKINEVQVSTGDYIYVMSPSPNDGEDDSSIANLNSYLAIYDSNQNFKVLVELNEYYDNIYNQNNIVQLENSINHTEKCIDLNTRKETACKATSSSNAQYIQLGPDDQLEIEDNNTYSYFDKEPTFNKDNHNYFITSAMQYSYIDK